jgi:hypothetical protein
VSWGLLASFLVPQVLEIGPHSFNVRWMLEGTGKSDGVRIVYLDRNETGEVSLLTL